MVLELVSLDTVEPDDPLMFVCPYCLYREITFMTNHTGQVQSKCNACQAMGPATAKQRHSKNHLKNVFRALHQVPMIDYKGEKI